MVEADLEFREKLLATFAAEAEEHAAALARGLSEYESATPESATRILETIFREAHSLKGAARAVGQVEIERVCQALESVFDASRKAGRPPSTETFDLLHQGVDLLGGRVANPSAALPVQGIVDRLERAAVNRVEPASAPPRTLAAPPARDDTAATVSRGIVDPTLRISAARLGAMFDAIAQLLTAKAAAHDRAKQLDRLRSVAQGRDGSRMGAPQDVAARICAAADAAQQDARALARQVDDLLEDGRALFLMPCSALLAMFPKLVRDLCHDLGKQADLLITGDDIEIDRRVLDRIKDPLMHLVRNAVDHGIESPVVRQQRQKPLRGKLAISIERCNDRKIRITVSDDGAGVDLESLRTALVKSGRLTTLDSDRLGERALLDHLFSSGVSTSAMITDLSGRGLGLAIVRDAVELLGGSVDIESKSHSGTNIKMEVPIAIATFRGILVQASGQGFVLPTAAVRRALRVTAGDVQSIEHRPAINVDGKLVGVASLSSILGLPTRAQVCKYESILVISSGGSQVAITVDEIVCEQEFLVKNLGPELASAPGTNGAAVMGDGSLVLVLSPADLLRSASREEAPLSATAAAAPSVRHRLLVVEDSITARTLLKNILELAGYEVQTAVDGIDALSSIRSDPVDLVVSDVDMPRMNGFELTSKIRHDKRTEEMPVVLVTALQSPEDRERGVEVGADAYIVKSSFDQSDLLDAVQRLL